MEIFTYQNENYVVLNPKTDSCPICETPIKDSYFSYTYVHGNADISCCNANYQLTGYSVQDESEEFNEFVKSLDSPDRILLEFHYDWIEPANRAMKLLNVKDINSQIVYQLAKQYHGEAEAREVK